GLRRCRLGRGRVVGRVVLGYRTERRDGARGRERLRRRVDREARRPPGAAAGGARMSPDLDRTATRRPRAAGGRYTGQRRRLRAAGRRYTGQRRRLVELLAEAGRPMTIPDILVVRSDLKQSSVYRNLADLEQAGVVRRVATDEGFGRYELAEDLIGHHHHLVC